MKDDNHVNRNKDRSTPDGMSASSASTKSSNSLNKDEIYKEVYNRFKKQQNIANMLNNTDELKTPGMVNLTKTIAEIDSER